MRQRLPLLLFCLWAGVLRLVAQPGPAAATTGFPVVEQVAVLPDRGYSLAQIRTDTSLAFAPADSLRPAQGRQFWLKLTVRNPSHYATAARLTLRPALDNTLYYFDEDARTWRHH
ncbi:hypothetical protein, partial [Hymenobacter agri]